MTVATIYASRDAIGNSTATGAAGTTGTVASSTATTLTIGTISGCSGTAYYNSFLWFDVSSLAGKYATAASFNYWVTAAQPLLTVKAYRALTTWLEVDGTDGPTYDETKGSGDLDVSTAGAYTSSSDAKFRNWVQGWIENSFPNGGFILDWPAGTGFVQIASQDTSGTANDPYLSVTYTGKPVVSALGTPPPSASIPAAGNVTVGLTFTDPDGDTMAQVAIRRIRLTGA